jgi:hypothetical protein
MSFLIVLQRYCLFSIMTKSDWPAESKRVLKSQLALKGVSYKLLARLLGEIGVTETPESIASKISRGTFSLTFFLQCTSAIGATEVTINPPRRPTKPLTAEDGWINDD